MKIVLTGSKEFLACYLRDYLKSRGHEAWMYLSSPDGEDQFSFEDMEKEGFRGADVVINLPEQQVIKKASGDSQYQEEFRKTRVEPTRRVRNAILREKNPPKLWVSFSSVSCYPKEEEQLYKESDGFGDDLTAQLVKEWEEAAKLHEDCPTRTVISRVGLIISREVGLLAHIVPLFRWGLGSIIGHGPEAFPWIYYKDLCMFLVYVMEHDIEQGIYNTVAPQMITSRVFSEALAHVMQRRIRLKLPQRYFEKKLGDVAEIVLAKSKVYPSRLLKTGYSFRYPAIYPALVDAFSGKH